MIRKYSIYMLNMNTQNRMENVYNENTYWIEQYIPNRLVIINQINQIKTTTTTKNGGKNVVKNKMEENSII